MMHKILTVRGTYQQDMAGSYHYEHHKHGAVFEAACDAVNFKPGGHACWFWFNDTCCPIQFNDNSLILVDRWNEWREAFQKHDSSFNDKFRTWKAEEYSV